MLKEEKQISGISAVWLRLLVIPFWAVWGLLMLSISFTSLFDFFDQSSSLPSSTRSPHSSYCGGVSSCRYSATKARRILLMSETEAWSTLSPWSEDLCHTSGKGTTIRWRIGTPVWWIQMKKLCNSIMPLSRMQCSNEMKDSFCGITYVLVLLFQVFIEKGSRIVLHAVRFANMLKRCCLESFAVLFWVIYA